MPPIYSRVPTPVGYSWEFADFWSVGTLSWVCMANTVHGLGLQPIELYVWSYPSPTFNWNCPYREAWRNLVKREEYWCCVRYMVCPFVHIFVTTPTHCDVPYGASFKSGTQLKHYFPAAVFIIIYRSHCTKNYLCVVRVCLKKLNLEFINMYICVMNDLYKSFEQYFCNVFINEICP